MLGSCTAQTGLLSVAHTPYQLISLSWTGVFRVVCAFLAVVCVLLPLLLTAFNRTTICKYDPCYVWLAFCCDFCEYRQEWSTCFVYFDSHSWDLCIFIRVSVLWTVLQYKWTCRLILVGTDCHKLLCLIHADSQASFVQKKSMSCICCSRVANSFSPRNTKWSTFYCQMDLKETKMSPA